MLSLKKIIAVVFVIYGAKLLGACTEPQLHLLEELHKTNNGKSVFVVVIDSVSPSHAQGFLSYGTVLEVFKGSVGNTVVINSGGYTSAGGQYLIPHDRYLVFADQIDDVFTAFVCDELSTNLYPSDTKDDMEKEKNDQYAIVKQWYKLHNEKYTGPYEYKINGNIAATGQYKAGIADGLWSYYKKYDVHDYKLYAKINYQNGVLDGEVLRWHSSFSFREEESIYKKEALISKKLYAKFPKKNVFYLASETTIATIDGQKIEHYTAFDTAFQTIKKYNYLYTGINFECPYFSLIKVMHGEYYDYDAINKQKIEGQYSKGSRVGLWKTTAKDGKTINEENIPANKQLKDSLIVENTKGSYFKGRIKNNQPIGTWVVKDKEKYYFALIPFENGSINGWVTQYTQYGSDYIKELYKDGVKNGPSFTIDTSINDTLRIAAYYKGKLNGIQKTFHKNGKLNSVSNFNNGVQSGKELIYDDAGALVLIANYVDDMKHGPYEAYDSRGGNSEKGLYFHGLRAGYWKEKYGTEPVTYFIVRTKKENFYKSVPESHISEYANDPEYEVLRNIK